jgi:hypothetical protein
VPARTPRPRPEEDRIVATDRLASASRISRRGSVYSGLVDRLPMAGHLVERLLPVGVDFERPVIIAALRNSGADLLYRILSAHPDLFLYQERLPGDGGVGSRARSERKRSVNLWNLDAPDEFRAWIFRHIGPQVRLGYRRWGAKLTLEPGDPFSEAPNVQDLRKLVRRLPASKTIGIIRDPRDYVLAGMRQFGRNAEWWIDDFMIVARLFCELRARVPERFLVVRYEDVVRRPRETVARCCAFAEIDFLPELLEPAGGHSRGAPPPWHGDGIDRISAWRAAEGLDRLTVEQVERSCFPVACGFGYAPESTRIPYAITEALQSLAAVDTEAPSS